MSSQGIASRQRILERRVLAGPRWLVAAVGTWRRRAVIRVTWAGRWPMRPTRVPLGAAVRLSPAARGWARVACRCAPRPLLQERRRASGPDRAPQPAAAPAEVLGGARPHSSPADPSPCCSRHKRRPQTPRPGSVSRTPRAALPTARRFLHVCRHHWLRRPWPQLRTPPQACSADSPLPLSENDSPPATG